MDFVRIFCGTPVHLHNLRPFNHKTHVYIQNARSFITQPINHINVEDLIKEDFRSKMSLKENVLMPMIALNINFKDDVQSYKHA